MSYLYSFGGRGGSGGEVTINTTVNEITASGRSEDPGQVLIDGVDGGVLLTGPLIRDAVDATLGGSDWRLAEAERLMSYDVPSRTVGILGGTGVALPLATTSDAGLMSAADKQALAAAGGGTGTATEISRAQLAVTSVEPGVASVRTNGYGVAGDGGGGLYVRAASEPSHGGKVQSADGAWWELVAEAGRVHVLQFGAARTLDGTPPTVDAYPAFAAAIDFAELLVTGTTGVGLTIEVPPGRYLIGQTLELRASTRLIGQASTGIVDGWAAELDFPDIAGIILHSARSIDASNANEDPDNAATVSARGAVIEGLHLNGPGAGGGFDPLKPGIRAHTRCLLRDLRVSRFSGHGIHIEAAAGAFGSNANTWVAQNISAQDNGGSGFFVKGIDANSGHGFGFDLSRNGRWGLEDRSFLGNHYFGVGTQANGIARAGQDGASALVTFAGELYCATVGATEAQLAATQPGTDEDVWRRCLGALSFPPADAPIWVPGQPDGTYVLGGAALFDGATNETLLAGFYAEENQPVAAIDQRVTAIGGIQGDMARASNGKGYAQVGPRVGAGSALRFAEDEGVELQIRSLPDEALRVASSGTPDGLRLRYNGVEAGGAITWQVRFDADISQVFTLDESTASFGRPDPVGRGHTYFKQGAFLGSASGGRQVIFGADAAAGEDHGPGDLVLSNAPAASAPVGWLWLSAHDADGAAGVSRALWQVPTLDGAVTLPALDAAARASEGAAGHAGTLVQQSERGMPAVSDGTVWRDLRAVPVAEKSASATLAAAEAFGLLRFTGAAAQVLTVEAGTLAVGEQVSLLQSGTGGLSLAAGAGVTIDTETTLSLRGQHAIASLICVAADTYLLVGGLAES